MLLNNHDYKSLAFLLQYYIAMVLCWIYHSSLQGNCALLACTVSMLCYYSFACACITHNCMHAKCFRSQGAEHIFRHLLSVAYGHPVSTFVPGHNLSHHRHLQGRKDPMRTSKMRFDWHFLNLAMFHSTVARSVFMMDVRYANLQKKTGTPYFTQAAREWAVVGAVNLALAILDWRRFLLYVYLPHLFAQWGIVSMNMLQHDGCDVPVEGAGTDFNSSRNFTGWLVNFLTFNNGFHTVHHISPTLHWSQLPCEHAKIEHKIHPSLNQTSMPRYMVRTFLYPGRREHFLGGDIALPPVDTDVDQDWTEQHAPAGVALKDYNVELSLKSARVCLGVLLLKVADPLYSVVFRVI